MTSSTSVGINLARREMVILGTEYAGEMKKGIFSVRAARLSPCTVHTCAADHALLDAKARCPVSAQRLQRWAAWRRHAVFWLVRY